MTFLIGGFALGLAASVHCIVMCGPLMMAVLSRRGVRAAAFYHGARLMTYALLGALAGAAGHLAGLAGFGRVLSVVAGLALIWAAARRAGWLTTSGADGERTVGRRMTNAIVRTAQAVRARWRESSPLHIVSAGIVNGLLPCGPVYAALTAAAALGESTRSAGFMLAFGAGTLPVLAAAGTIARWAPRVRGGRWRFVTPVTLAVLGVLLTARGIASPQHDSSSCAAGQHSGHVRISAP